MTRSELEAVVSQHPALAQSWKELQGMQGFLNVGSTEWAATPVEQKVKLFDSIIGLGVSEGCIFEAFLDHMEKKGYGAPVAVHVFSSAMSLFDLGNEKVEVLRAWGLKV